MRKRLLCCGLLVALSSPVWAQLSPTFTYQGRLEDGGVPKNGPVDLLITPFNTSTGGTGLVAPLVLDAVPVVNGIFSARVNLGSAVFLGDPIFLQIGVREDSAGGVGDLGGFTTLAPRQEVTPAPYALHAEGVAFNAITGAQIAPNTITGSDVADGSLTASDINTTSTITGVQRRLSAPCPTGQALSDISSSGVPACMQPLNSVVGAAGSGINVTTSAGVATLSTDANETQARITGECQSNPASAIRRNNSDGTVACVRVGPEPTPLGHVVLDSAGDVGSHLSMRRGEALGDVLVAYYDDTNNRLKFMRCNDINCSAPSAPIIVDDPANDVGQFVSMAFVVGGNGMAYYDATAGDLKYAHCSNANCTGPIAVRTIDSAGDVGRFAEIVLLGNAFGIAYYDATNNHYKWAFCNDAACSAPTLTALSDIGGGGLLATDIAASRNQSTSPLLPFFSVIRGGNEVIAVICGNTLCTTRSTPVLDSTAISPPLTAAERLIAGKRLYWIAYGRLPSSFGLRVCLNDGCTVTDGFGGALLIGPVIGHTVVARNEGTPIRLQTDANDSRLAAQDFLTASSSVAAYRLAGTPTANGAVDATLIASGSSSGGVGIVYFDTVARDLIYQRCQQSDCREL